MEIEFSWPHLLFTKITGQLAANQMLSFVGMDIYKHLKSQDFKLTTITSFDEINEVDAAAGF